MNQGDLLLTANLVKEIEPSVPGPWLMMVGKHGRRFVDESAPYGVVTPLALKHGPSWVILDDRLVRSAKPDPASAWGAGTWTADSLTARHRGRTGPPGRHHRRTRGGSRAAGAGPGGRGTAL